MPCCTLERIWRRLPRLCLYSGISCSIARIVFLSVPGLLLLRHSHLCAPGKLSAPQVTSKQDKKQFHWALFHSGTRHSHKRSMCIRPSNRRYVLFSLRIGCFCILSKFEVLYALSFASICKRRHWVESSRARASRYAWRGCVCGFTTRHGGSSVYAPCRGRPYRRGAEK